MCKIVATAETLFGHTVALVGGAEIAEDRAVVRHPYVTSKVISGKFHLPSVTSARGGSWNETDIRPAPRLGRICRHSVSSVSAGDDLAFVLPRSNEQCPFSGATEPLIKEQ
jgi:hypothetical protein